MQVNNGILWALFRFFTGWFFTNDLQIRGWHNKIGIKIEIETERLTVKRQDASKVYKIAFKDASEVSKIETEREKEIWTKG